ncbi:MAG: type 2 isopentenyl-diphosphate Delta-isomerase [Candidatus Micrarchaeota archaeon]
MKKTESRKKDHVELTLNSKYQYEVSPGFQSVRFVHNSLPELDFDSIDLSSSFLGKKIKYPFMILGMTGGYKDAEKINKDLAIAAEKHKIPMGLGSQRAMIEDKKLAKTYNVRKYAPSIPLVANIGGVQLKKYPMARVKKMIEDVDADALAIHLNPLQEIIQPEGDRDFRGVLTAITKACQELNVPIIVKETGAGISTDVAVKLKDAGVAYVDVSGAGGTSWSKVEYDRGKAVEGFEEWGNATVDSIDMCRDILPLIASGGIRSGIDVAKAIALNAELAGAAYPFLKAQKKKKLDELIGTWERQMKIVCLLTGSSNCLELKNARLIRYGRARIFE